MSMIYSAFNYASEMAGGLVKQAVSAKNKVSEGVAAVGGHLSENKYKYLTVAVAAAVILGTTYFLQSEVGPVRHRGQMFVEMDAVNDTPTISLGTARRLSSIILNKPLKQVVDPGSMMVS